MREAVAVEKKKNNSAFNFQQLKYSLRYPQGNAKKHVCLFEFLALYLTLHARGFWFCYKKTVTVNPIDTLKYRRTC